MLSPHDLIAALGGPKRVAEALASRTGRGISAAAVSHWSKVARIPAWWVAPLVELGVGRDIPITAAQILSLNATPKPRDPRSCGLSHDADLTATKQEKFEEISSHPRRALAGAQ